MMSIEIGVMLSAISTPALCQDCLRLFRVDQLIPDAGDPPGRCPSCGGQTCDCHACMRAVERFAAGNFREGTKVKIVSWTPDGGAVCK